MIVKEKIRELVEDSKGHGYANACQLWKGLGEMGQGPYGWWLKPFNQTARWIGSRWEEIKEMKLK